MNNNAESNSGSLSNPPSGNTEKVVIGKIRDWIVGTDDESRFFQVGRFSNTAFLINAAVNARQRCELQVDTIRYLSVGDILVSKDGYVNVQITSLTSPNKVVALWLKRTKDYENVPGRPSGNDYIYDAYLYDIDKISWSIIKKVP